MKSCCIVLIVATTLIPAVSRGALTLSPGSLVVSSYSSGTLRQINSATGQITHTLQLQLPDGGYLPYVDSITYVEGNIYVGYEGLPGVLRVNPLTGETTPTITGIYPSGLGNRDNTIISGAINTVNQYSVAGDFISTSFFDYQSHGLFDFEIKDMGWNGSEYIVLVNADSGIPAYSEVYRFGPNNEQFGGFRRYSQTSPSGQGLSSEGFDYDPATDTLWIAMYDNVGTRSYVRHFHRTEQDAFQTFTYQSFANISDVAYIPIPAPGVLTLATLGGFCAFRRRR